MPIPGPGEGRGGKKKAGKKIKNWGDPWYLRPQGLEVVASKLRSALLLGGDCSPRAGTLGWRGARGLCEGVCGGDQSRIAEGKPLPGFAKWDLNTASY